MLVIAAAAGTAGYLIAQGEPRIVKEKELPVPVVAEGERIEKDAKILWHIDYRMCGHSLIFESSANENMIGLSFTQFQTEYPDLQIIEFSPSSIELKKSYNCYCPDHFILKKSGDVLAVIRTSPGTDKQDIYIKTQVYFKDIKEDERRPVEIGRVFSSFDDLEDYIAKITE